MDIPALAHLDGVKPELHESVTRALSQLTRGDQKLAKRLSPITHVSADAPPHFLVHGTSDRLVPPTQSERMHDALRQAGAISELMLVPEGTHAMPPGDSEEMHRTLDFFRRQG
jgi:dipeptidyl aminopeptidase/acylaminoacyl peptidase